MRIHNNLVLLLILLSGAGCKTGITKNEGVQNVPDSSGISNAAIAPANDAKNLNDSTGISNSDRIAPAIGATKKITDKSFVLSCGTECAITYIADSMTRLNAASIKVYFTIENYVQEALKSTNHGTFIFIYDASGKVVKVQEEGEEEDPLESQIPFERESFINLGNSLLIQQISTISIEQTAKRLYFGMQPNGSNYNH
jgi:hypothetical protein